MDRVTLRMEKVNYNIIGSDSKEISFKGEYNKGKKCGKWETSQVIYGAN